MSTGSSQNSREDRAREAVVTAALVLEICDEVGTCWDDLGIKLNLSAAAVRNVDADVRFARDKAKKILHIWMEEQGNDATVGNLEDALMALQKRAIAKKLIAFQMNLQNEGHRDGAQTSRSRARNSDGNHGNPPGVSFGTVNFGSSSNVTFIGFQQGGINLNAPKQE